MLSTVLDFPKGRVIVPFLRPRPQVEVIMNFKRFDVLLDNKICVIRLYLFVFFACFLLKSKEDQYE